MWFIRTKDEMKNKGKQNKLAYTLIRKKYDIILTMKSFE